jgi:DNA-cytosine methyltransferase
MMPSAEYMSDVCKQFSEVVQNPKKCKKIKKVANKARKAEGVARKVCGLPPKVGNIVTGLLRPLSVGSACTGWGSESQALELLNVPHKIIFGCDCNRAVEMLFKANFKFKRWHSNVHDPMFKKEVPVDIFAAGFPCQPYSSEGRNLGEKDIRSLTVTPILHYLARAQPTVFFLENVIGLLNRRHEHIFTHIMHKHEDIKDKSTGEKTYMVQFKVLDSKLHGGVPQTWRRLYIVGIKHTCYTGNFTWPLTIWRRTLKTVLQESMPQNKRHRATPPTWARASQQHATSSRLRGHRPWKEDRALHRALVPDNHSN